MRTKRKNNICVIGVGRFGTAIIEGLIEQNIPVIVIDIDEKELEKYGKTPLVTPIIADASDINTLQALGIDEVETTIVAIPNNIEIVATLLELNVQHVIARASSVRHARVLKQIGVDMIVRPETEAGVRTALIAANSNFIKFSKTLTELGNGFVMGSTQILNKKFVNTPLKDLKFNKIGITLVLFKRDNKTFLPTADSKFEFNDELMVVGKITDVTKFFGSLNDDSHSSPRVTRSRK